MLQRGDKFRRKSDGKVFVLKTVENEHLILETEDGSNQIMIGKDTLMSSFKKIEEPHK